MTKNEVKKVIVNDYVYAEYGLEKEIINKAIENFRIYEDETFKSLLDSLSEYHNTNDSFLSI